MARFVFWPGLSQVKNHILYIPPDCQAVLMHAVAVAECATDYKVKLVNASDQPALGSADLDESLRSGTNVPVILKNVQDGDKVQVLHKVTGNSWSVPLTIRIVTQIGVGPAASPEVKASVSKALRLGRIRGDNGQIAAVIKDGFFIGKGGKKYLLADAMFYVLDSLAQGGILVILSLMDNRGAPHGETMGDDVRVCWGMDIAAYAGYLINLTNGNNADNTIAGVAAVISNLPAGNYKFGLTRPSDHPGGDPMPDKDVFLPMATMKTMYAHMPLSEMNEPARTAIANAVAGNPKARIEPTGWFEDGVDHVHVEVWDGKPR